MENLRGKVWSPLRAIIFVGRQTSASFRSEGEPEGREGSMPGGASAYLTFANENRNAVRDELVRAQGSEGTGKVGIAQVRRDPPNFFRHFGLT